MNNIYNIGKLIQIKENNLYNIKSKISFILNQNNINWYEINEFSNKSLVILNEIDKLRNERIEIIKSN